MKNCKITHGWFLLATLVGLALSVPVYADEIVGWGRMKTPNQPLNQLTRIAGGGAHSLALRSDGSIVAMGTQ